jgi:hypothetical protein
MGIPHPSHPFIESHPMVYKIARVAWKKLSINEILADEESMFAR